LIVLLKGQINFIRELISETLNLEAQFELNREDWNFKGPNLIFTKSINWNRKQNCKKKMKFKVA